MPRLLLIWSLLLYAAADAQTFTMAKGCREKNANGQLLIKEKKYDQALTAFSEMQTSCKTKDGKEASAIGKAEALNGLGRYQEAIAASDVALKATKNKSLGALFQKAISQKNLKQYEASSQTFARILELTEKNQDTKTRASNYALMATMQWRYLGHKDSADYFLQKAITLDPTNANFVLQKGDMYADEKKYDEAFAQYDKAIGMGKNDLEVYMAKASLRMKMMQEKYNTTEAQELRSKMTKAETETLCADLKQAIALGLSGMQYDMFVALVCK